MMSGNLVCGIDPFELSVRLEGNNIGNREPKLFGDLGHAGKHGEELGRGIAPPLAIPADEKVAFLEAPLGWFFNEDSRDAGQRIAPFRAPPNPPANITHVNPVTSSDNAR